MIKVLIVDDSSFVRRTLKAVLERDKGIEVVGSASDGIEALELIRKLDPDLVTLDIEMPRLDGLGTLKRIMAENPCPVIMISSLTSEGAPTALKALELGALDYMGKPGSYALDQETVQEDLVAKVRALAPRKILMRLIHRGKTAAEVKARPVLAANGPGEKNEPAAPRHSFSSISPAAKSSGGKRAMVEVVCIGVSTGGPPAVQKILSALPENFPAPVLVAQHMPMAFTGPFAERLNGLCAVKVMEIFEPVRLQPGRAYICRGGRHLRVENRGGALYGLVQEEPKAALYKPSVNELLGSAGLVLGRNALGVMLTGMGSDGLEGARVLKEKGGYMIAQSEESCVVYGMPKAVVDARLADEVIGIDSMAQAILTRCGV